MKSVKEISKELGVSKQTIFNNKKRLDIETIKKDNTSFIKNDIDVEKIIQRVTRIKKKYGFEDTLTNSKKLKKDNSQKESKHNVQIIELLEKQIDTLNKQLEKQEKRHEVTVEFYRKELQERSKLLENQQILALESNKKSKKLESQLEEERQLNNSFDTVTSNRQNINPQEELLLENLKISTSNKKKSQPTENEINHKDVSEGKKNDSTKEDKFVEETKSNSDDNREVEPPKKGFWSRFFGN
jgi:acetolactate synthase regulatory subunit